MRLALLLRCFCCFCREADLTLLQQVLQQEAEDEAAEVAARAAKQQEVADYRRQLAHAMQKEAEDASQQVCRVG